MDANSPIFYFITFVFDVICKKSNNANLFPDSFYILSVCLGVEHIFFANFYIKQ